MPAGVSSNKGFTCFRE